MNLEKLKDTARKFEQKEDWRRAIELYLKAIQEFESGREPSPDLSLYNRIGDLYLKTGDSPAALRAYERAVELYAEQGFLNNAIALCGKILRVNSARLQTYLTLAQLHARKNVLIEAKRNLLEYLERMNAVGQVDEAFAAVQLFADQYSGNQDIRLMLAELLRASSRTAAAREQLEKAAADLDAHGDVDGAQRTRDRLHAIERDERPSAATAAGPRAGDLVFLDTGAHAAKQPLPAAEAAPPAAETPVEQPLGLESFGEVDLAASDADMLDGLMLAEPSDEVAAAPGEALELDRPGEVDLPSADEPVALDDLELTAAESFGAEDAGVAPLDGLLLSDPADAIGDGTEAEGLDELQIERVDDAGLDLDMLAADDSDEFRGSESAIELDMPADGFADEPADTPYGAGEPDLLFIDSGEDEAPEVEAPEVEAPEVEAPDEASWQDPPQAAFPGIEALEDRVLDDPDDPEAHRALGEALLAADDLARGVEELAHALRCYEVREEWASAVAVVRTLARQEPGDVRHYQKQVELAFRVGDRAQLLEAYLELGDVLGRLDADDKALAVYRRVTEHDPGNQRARAAIARLEAASAPPPMAPPAMRPPAPPAAAPPAPAPGFVDLGAMILEHDAPRDTRMRVEGEDEPTGDEQRDFEEMLAAFKRGIEQNLASDDYETHYDLGVAFKEMGLLDEAIAEFQKALRAPEGRLRTSEALGQAFLDKGQFAIAETILRRAVDGLQGGDDVKIGLLYWLGRAAEEQGKHDAAMAAYERALAVDIRFRDIGERIHRLTAGRRQ